MGCGAELGSAGTVRQNLGGCPYRKNQALGS